LFHILIIGNWRRINHGLKQQEPEEIVSKLPQVEKFVSQGPTHIDAIQEASTPEQR
jgi:hypothetical protein